MMQNRLSFQNYHLDFIQPSGTSRGILTQKETFLLKCQISGNENIEYFGEAGLFRGLSADDVPEYETKLKEIVETFDFNNGNWWEELRIFPSIQFGLEQIEQTIKIYQGKPVGDEFNPTLFPSKFTEGKAGIPINGLIWMGKKEFMIEQIQDKLEKGFRCIKLKIGVDWEMEHEILKNLREKFPAELLEIRVDANGGFSFEKAKFVLEELHKLEVHSIEQPIKAGQVKEMAELCDITPTPIALDEELIGVFEKLSKKEVINQIKPQFIILKPSLVGGWKGSQEWIDLANENQIGWWITSALESNIGLNAIAQWTYTLNSPLPQGLGTGSLFQNNFHSRLKVQGDQLYFV
jgi:O-succinylbenzoate synthase